MKKASVSLLLVVLLLNSACAYAQQSGARNSPERIADWLKAYSTRRLRELGLVDRNTRVWSRGRSRRYLWKPKHVEAAVHYVLYCQSDIPFELDDWVR